LLAAVEITDCVVEPLVRLPGAACAERVYHGQGGREYFLPEHCCPIDVGDILGFNQAAERMLELGRKSPAALAEMGRRACAHVRQNYSLQREEEDIVGAWRELLGGQ
jgi:hypothetical protein